jgi:hypothetical protein
MISDAEILFLKLLNLLAFQAKLELTKDDLALYDRTLSHHGYDNINQVLDQLLKEQKPGQPMPSVAEIERRLNKHQEASAKAQANTCAQNLIRCVSKYGYTWPMQKDFQETFKKECGDLGDEIIRLYNGWPNFSERVNEAADNMETFRAQLRDLAASILERSSLGINPWEMPELAPGKTKDLVASLTRALAPSLE